MNKTVWLVVLVCLIASGVFIYWALNKPGNDAELAQLDSVRSKNDILLPAVIVPTKSDNKASPLMDDEDPYANELFKEQLVRVADLYEQTLKFPVGSQPVRNPEDVRAYKPYEESEVDLPFPSDDSDDDPIRVAAASDAYQYFAGDVINIRVQLSRVADDEFVSVEGVLSGAGRSSNRDFGQPLDFSVVGQSRSVFMAAFDTRTAASGVLTDEMLAKLTIKVGARELFTTVAFRYAVASAQIIGIQPASVQEANLQIPVMLNVYQSGYYYLSSVLEDQVTGKPLIQLQSEARLPQGNALINLNAHIAALRYHGLEGPYTLRSIKLYRGSDVGEVRDSPASTLQASWAVQGFPFSDYSDEEYRDEYGEENLDFLRDVGEVPEQGDTPDSAQSPL